VDGVGSVDGVAGVDAAAAHAPPGAHLRFAPGALAALQVRRACAHAHAHTRIDTHTRTRTHAHTLCTLRTGCAAGAARLRTHTHTHKHTHAQTCAPRSTRLHPHLRVRTLDSPARAQAAIPIAPGVRVWRLHAHVHGSALHARTHTCTQAPRSCIPLPPPGRYTKILDTTTNTHTRATNTHTHTRESYTPSEASGRLYNRPPRAGGAPDRATRHGARPAAAHGRRVTKPQSRQKTSNNTEARMHHAPAYHHHHNHHHVVTLKT
jgi:hypothetical protein